MSVAAAAGAGCPADPCPAARQLEEALAYGEEDKRARAECAEEYVKCGRRHGEDGRLDVALECFERAVGLHGMWAACADECGRIAARLAGGGKLAGAVVWYEKAIKYTDRAPQQNSKKKGRDPKRKKWASKCIKCWDGLVAATAAAADGQPPAVEMEAPYRAAAAADPSRAETHVQMGGVERGRGRHGEAAACYGRALEIDPLNTDAALGAGRALEDSRQWARAAALYEGVARTVARLRRECAAGCARCAGSLEAVAKLDDAASAFKAAAKLDASHALECARALDRMGRPDEALAAFKAAAKLDSSHALECARMHRKRADGLARELERERGEPRPGGGARAAAEAGTAAKGGPESGCAEEAAAQLYEEAAGWYYQAAAKAGDGSGEAGKGCLECARALDRMGRPDEALAAFKAAAKLDSSHALECARMHRKRADGLVRELERERERAGARPGGGARPAAGAGAAKGGPESDCAEGAAAQLYEEAAGWYYQAAAKAGDGSGEAGKGCLECARALDRMGRPDEALAAFKMAAKLDSSHALECARMHRKRADGLAAVWGHAFKKGKKNVRRNPWAIRGCRAGRFRGGAGPVRGRRSMHGGRPVQGGGGKVCRGLRQGRGCRARRRRGRPPPSRMRRVVLHMRRQAGRPRQF